ncbi:MAG: MaoC family dehydratase [Pseudomonadota bacterium]
MKTRITMPELEARTGAEVGLSRWFEMDQPRIDRFADVTEDAYFIHTDPERAKSDAPFGGTIAHGFLTLSLLSAMSYDALPELEGKRMQVNYGFDRIRFVAPVPSGASVRGRFLLSKCARTGPEEATMTYAVSVEIKNGERPALAAEWIARVWGDFWAAS